MGISARMAMSCWHTSGPWRTRAESTETDWQRSVDHTSCHYPSRTHEVPFIYLSQSLKPSYLPLSQSVPQSVLQSRTPFPWQALCTYFQDQASEDHYLNSTSKAVVENVTAGKSFPDTGKSDDAEASAFVKARLSVVASQDEEHRLINVAAYINVQ